MLYRVLKKFPEVEHSRMRVSFGETSIACCTTSLYQSDKRMGCQPMTYRLCRYSTVIVEIIRVFFKDIPQLLFSSCTQDRYSTAF